MAEKATVAFGSYLRSLREERGLTLRGVCDVTRASHNTIDKAALSRLERGQQGPSVPMLVALGRVYAVPPDVLLERHELDWELDAASGVDTADRAFTELQRLGREALLRGSRKWDAYACYRDSVARALVDPLDPRFGSADRQAAVARLNLATVARSLGKNRYALFEYRQLDALGGLPPPLRPVLLDRISNCHRCLGDFDLALRTVEQAMHEASITRDRRGLAFTHFSRASIALDQADDAGIEDLRRAFRLYREADDGGVLPPNPTFEIDTLLKLADAFFHAGRLEKAGRAALAATRLSRSRDIPAGQAFGDLLLGRVDERTGNANRAVLRWRRASATAARIRNKRLQFAAEFSLYSYATTSRSPALARASQRRLERLMPWVPQHLPELLEFKMLAGDRRLGASRLESVSHPTHPSR